MTEGLIHHSLLSNIHILRTMEKDDLIELIEDLQDKLSIIEEQWKETYAELEKSYDETLDSHAEEIKELNDEIAELKVDIRKEEKEYFKIRQLVSSYFNEHELYDEFWNKCDE